MNIFSVIANLAAQYEAKEANAVFLGVRELAHLRSSLNIIATTVDESAASIELGQAKVCGLYIIPLTLKSHLSVGYICVSPQVTSPQAQSLFDSVPLKSSKDMDAIYRTRLKRFSDALSQQGKGTASDKSTSPEPKL